MKKRVPTIRDVAASAGVSVATVSKFMNGTQRFSAPVEARLKATIARLGYQSNPHARYMVTGETRTIGVAVLDIRNPHFTSLVKGANRIALQFDYTLLLVDLEENAAREYQLIEALARRVDGLLLNTRMADDATDRLAPLNKPIVMINRASDDSKVASVSPDNHRAGFMLAQHLLNQNYRDIGYLGYPQSRANTIRLEGVTDCLASAGLAPRVFEADSPTAAAGERACSSILFGPERPDALICYNDLIALGFLKEARNLGFSLPGDVAVCGFDNISHGEYAWPGLTTVDIRSERLGEIAMLRLVDALAGKPASESGPLEPRLIVRESTLGRPRGA
ncbi:LacI family DNA-binding transcriptional regulator [Paraburkholderia caballeronis]|uniref:Transcriptional regulator, LacI family n=1 Tax=Paraburkholderia caballeronis TaxID=416943 RepID=A0A1H7W227_9BURK|nr:LacI family DNA-binding transcriptional regulator [Paraburkholderia caballeronis]PXW14532.1 LacI family transcriptional regulator [Paraburkholderia caballeronis]PXW92892.1 LacI family transcriptional regulator [Paraburkholderia caballeronis]RAJ86630.1 LacI family transcriptional regulator [Paraburkholderia caballeronis]TDV03409.1 LacI family transcriptional regulator [Paraburkholderia caballeronis]TDV07040.1 LacI family transcriptional regulator [Paraburkholderia caballeronis]